MDRGDMWLNWAMELQALSQSALYYCKDIYDIERFQRIREISAEIVAEHSDLPPARVKDLFCNETGYQTPKIDTRAAIFEDDQILLVQERNGSWSMPGGWCDINLSPAENTVKEAKEEAGLDVTAARLIAVQNQERHNTPRNAYSIVKFFFLCVSHGGQFTPNSETTDARYFSLQKLPPLAEEKCNRAQIELCFASYKAETWETRFDV